MTSRRNQKHAIRARMAITGEPYNVAARALRGLHARPDIGLPRRVPAANLVSGSAVLPPWRPLRIRRDPATLAQHLTSYLEGWDAGRADFAPHLADRYGQEAHAVRRTGLRSEQREARSRRMPYQLEGAESIAVLPDAAPASPADRQTSRSHLRSNG